MDLTTVIGLVLGFGGLLGAYVMEGGSPLALLGLSAAIIVFGGTIGALFISFPGKQLRVMPSLFRKVFQKIDEDPLLIINQLVDLATVARREGILALEDKIEGYTDEFFKNGVRLVVDGVDPDLVRSIMETELAFIQSRHESGVAMFEAAGGYAPTMGIIGTVMGLVHVLSNLSNVATLGPLIATAFVATLYGVSTANLVWLPIGNKLKSQSKSEMLIKEIVLEGVLSIQAGENPNILAQKLKVFLAPGDRERKVEHAAEETGGGAQAEAANA